MLICTKLLVNNNANYLLFPTGITSLIINSVTDSVRNSIVNPNEFNNKFSSNKELSCI